MSYHIVTAPTRGIGMTHCQTCNDWPAEFTAARTLAERTGKAVHRRALLAKMEAHHHHLETAHGMGMNFTPEPEELPGMTEYAAQAVGG